MKDCKNLIQVRIEDFDIRLLRQAAREGRLFIQPSETSETERQQQAIAQILQYVASIEDCASIKYRTHVRTIWNSIVRHPTILPTLIMRQGRHRGEPNKYRITAIATILLNRGVYRNEEFSAVDLHLRLEHATRRNVYYTNMDKYWLEAAERRALYEIFKDFPAV